MYSSQNRKSEIENPKSSGFSLIELIVVTAILAVVVSGIVAVFLGSMKAVRQGYRHMDAYEMTRGAFQVVQRDLTGGFTSRDNGDYYQFYGTPYGMTFVGVASSFQGIGNNQDDNLCRVSYVIRRISSDKVPTANSHKYDFIEVEEGMKPAYVLIRYVERGVDSLDSFKFIDWTGTQYGSDPDFPDGAAQAANLVNELDAAVTDAKNLGLGIEEQERFLSAKKRELWLRMLRGNGPVPDANGVLQDLPLSQQLPGYFRDYPGNITDTRPDPLDYVVATNLYFDDQAILDALVLENDTGHMLFGVKAFDYGFPYNRDVTIGSPGNPTFWRQYGQNKIVFTDFWNSSPVVNLANMPPQYPINDPSNPPILPSFGGEGSPLLPRIPAAVHLRVRLRFPAPTVAAAEIQRVLDQTIDIPTGFTRPQVGTS